MRELVFGSRAQYLVQRKTVPPLMTAGRDSGAAHPRSRGLWTSSKVMNKHISQATETSTFEYKRLRFLNSSCHHVMTGTNRKRRLARHFLTMNDSHVAMYAFGLKQKPNATGMSKMSQGRHWYVLRLNNDCRSSLACRSLARSLARSVARSLHRSLARSIARSLDRSLAH